MRQLVIPILSLLFLFIGCSTESTPVYLLTTSVTPEETGTVSPASGEFDEGTEVQIQAQPSEGYYFSRWDGDLSGSENPHTFTINADTDVTAVFERIEYSLNIDIEGEGTVQEEVLPAKSKDYPEGTVVQLEALPDDGWAFLEWRGDLEGEENPATINVDQEKNVTAVFDRAYSLSTTVIPDGVGSVEPSEGSFIAETTLEVEAVSTNSGWTFDRWQGDFSGTTNPFNLTMNEDKTLEAHFERREFSLELSSQGEGSLSTELISGTQTEDGYLYESEVEVSADPEDEWDFLRWEGDVESTENPLEITIEENMSIHAVFSQFAGGDGSSTNPYKIATIQQLQKVEHYLDRHFILISDIDASKTSGWNGGEGFKPIGDESDPFTGSLDGGGYKISGLTIDRQDEDYVGLFGYAEGTKINNTGLVNVSVSGNTWVGGLIGRSIGSGEVSDSHITGEVSGDTRVGGLVGRNEGEINDSYANSTVTATDRSVGGLVGSNRGTIQESHATGDVSGDTRVGGLVGSNFVPNGSGGVINDSYASGNVSGDDSVGGLVGRSFESSIQQSYATGDVSGTSVVGGLVGTMDGQSENGSIGNSYALGDVSGESVVGGLLGDNFHYGTVSNSYASGSITGNSVVGGLIGDNGFGNIESSYWDTDSSEQNDGVGDGSSSGATGLTTSEMTDDEAEDNMPEFDWEDIWRTTSEYPELQWQE